MSMTGSVNKVITQLFECGVMTTEEVLSIALEVLSAAGVDEMDFLYEATGVILYESLDEYIEDMKEIYMNRQKVEIKKMSDIEDIQAEERDEAVERFLDDIITQVCENIDYHGGSPNMFQIIISEKEIHTELHDALVHALPNNFGVKTKELS